MLHFVGMPFLAADAAAPAGGSPVYVVDGAASLPEHPPRAQFASPAELVTVLIRLFDEDVIRPDPADPRVPSLRGSPDIDNVRRLTRW